LFREKLMWEARGREASGLGGHWEATDPCSVELSGQTPALEAV